MITEKDFKIVFHYLRSLDININFSNFQFKVKNHPDFPSLLSITDTLNFFNIENGIISVDISKIELLPDRFVTLLSNHIKQPQLYFIEKIDGVYYQLIDNKKIELSKPNLESRWNNLVLLIEKSEKNEKSNINYKNYSWFLPVFCLITFIYIVFQFEASLQSKVFFIFPFIGILFSMLTVKELFGVQSSFLNHICNINAFNSCSALLSSNNWKIFEIINFSDLSIVFNFSQFVSLFIFLLINNTESFFSIQLILIYLSFPILILSVYYQKFVNRKWCPICLGLIFNIILQFGFLLLFHNYGFAISIFSVILYIFIFTSVTITWFYLKKSLAFQLKLKDFQQKNIKLIRNYDIFKNTLVSSSPIANNPNPLQSIILGNINASLKIGVVTSLHCKFCANLHSMIEAILNEHSERVCFCINFNFNLELADEKSKYIHMKLIEVYIKFGQEAFMQELHNWYKNPERSMSERIEIETKCDLKITEILNIQYNWIIKNEFTYTPLILINNYVFPEQYDSSELIYFINDLLDDHDLNQFNS